MGRAEAISTSHEWRALEDFRDGDLIHAWGRELVVTRVEPNGEKIRLVYRDGDAEKDITDRPGAEYIARKRS